MGGMQQTACLIFIPLIIDSHDLIFICTTVVRVSDSKTVTV